MVGGSELFSLEFQYYLLTKTAQHFIDLLESNAELEGHVHNAVWQGGTIWTQDDVETLTEVLENGKCLVVMARSKSYCGLKCTNILSQMGNIILRVKQQHCSQVFSKAYIVNGDTLKKDTVPLTIHLPRVEVSSALYAFRNNQEYVTDSSGAKIGRQKVNWLQRLTLKGKPFLINFTAKCISYYSFI